MLERCNLCEVSSDETKLLKMLVPENELENKMSDLRKSDSDIIARYPYTTLLGKRALTKRGNGRLSNTRRFPGRKLTRRTFEVCALGMICVFAVAAISSIFTGTKNAPDFGGGIDVAQLENTDRMKGQTTAPASIDGILATLRVYLKSADSAKEIASGSTLKENDTVQLVYNVLDTTTGNASTAKTLYGVIFSIDGRGVVTLHYPENVYASAKLQSGTNVPLSNAYILDDAPKNETFYFAVSQTELNVAEILDTAKNKLDNITGKYLVKTVLINKE
jgi:hypothetical protein